MEKTYYKGEHPESGKWMVGETTGSIGREIWDLVKGKGESEFLSLLREDPSSVSWSLLDREEYDSLSEPPTAKKKKRSGRVPVCLVSEFHIQNFESVSKLVEFLKGRVPKSKVMKMVEDPSLSYEGYSVRKL